MKTVLGNLLRSAASAAFAASLLVIQSAGGAGAVEMAKVKVAGFTWPAYGYWKIVEAQKLSDRISIEFTPIEDPHDSMALLASGNLDVVLNTLEYAPIAAEQKQPITVVAYYGISQGADKIILGPDIKDAKGLVGKNVGLLEAGLPEIFMSMWLENNGVDPLSIKKINIIADDVFAAMIGGSISAGVFWEPFATNVLKEKEGSRMVATSGDAEWLKSGVIADAVYMNANFVKDNPAVAEEFVRAHFAAIAWRAKNPVEGNALISEGMKMPGGDVEGVLGSPTVEGTLHIYSFAESARLCGSMAGDPPFGQLNGQINDIWRTINTWWVRLGKMKGTVDPKAGIDCSLMASLAGKGFTGEP